MINNLITTGAMKRTANANYVTSMWETEVPYSSVASIGSLSEFWTSSFIERISDKTSLSFGHYIPPASENQSTNLVADRKSILAVMAWVQMRQIASSPTKRELHSASRLIEQYVLQSFAGIDDVVLIYSDRIEPVHLFILFIRGETYDSTQMDILLEREFQLLQSMDHGYANFRYIPYVSRDVARECIPSSARLIFEG